MQEGDQIHVDLLPHEHTLFGALRVYSRARKLGVGRWEAGRAAWATFLLWRKKPKAHRTLKFTSHDDKDKT